MAPHCCFPVCCGRALRAFGHTYWFRPVVIVHAKPTGVDVPHRGHVIVVALGRTGATVGGAGVPNGTAPGMFAGMLGSGVGIGALDATITAGGSASDAPHDRQNFMPGGLSPRQTLQMMGNPPPAAGVC